MFVCIRAGTIPFWTSENPQHIVNVTWNDQLFSPKGKNLSTEEFSVSLLAKTWN